MKYYRSEIVKQAQSWIGCNEKDGSHKEIIDVYNSHEPLARGYKIGYNGSWCSAFVSAVAIKCGYTEIIPTEVSCYYHIELFKKLGCWVESDNYIPKPGDCILYDWEDTGKGDDIGSPNHIGIVEKVVGDTIHIIDGNNSNDAVGRRTIKINGKYIRGYGVPKYDADKPEGEEIMKFKKGDIVYALENIKLYTTIEHLENKYTLKKDEKAYVRHIKDNEVALANPETKEYFESAWTNELNKLTTEEPLSIYKELYEKQLLITKDLETQIIGLQNKINKAIQDLS